MGNIASSVGSVGCVVDAEEPQCVDFYSLFLCCYAQTVDPQNVNGPDKIKSELWVELDMQNGDPYDIFEFKANGVTKLTDDNLARLNSYAGIIQGAGFLVAEHTITKEQVPAVVMDQVGKAYFGYDGDAPYGDFLYADKVAFAYLDEGYVQIAITGEVSLSQFIPPPGEPETP